MRIKCIVSDNSLQKRNPSGLKEKGQYLLAFGVVAAMLVAANFPVFVVFFFGIFAFFVMKMFAAGSRSDTREIFEFYLSANEILRDDERRWYGFEINEAIRRGEGILQRMSGAPPLVHFTLGALYNKAGDHSSAVNHLAYIVENESSDEASFAFPSPELRSYVKVLRKIEREPADAPLTSAAVRALERARKLRAKSLLEESRSKMPPPKPETEAAENARRAMPPAPAHENAGIISLLDAPVDTASQPNEPANVGHPSVTEEPPRNGRKGSKKTKEDPFANRKPITEVLHDIYDKNIQ